MFQLFICSFYVVRCYLIIYVFIGVLLTLLCGIFRVSFVRMLCVQGTTFNFEFSNTNWTMERWQIEATTKHWKMNMETNQQTRFLHWCSIFRVSIFQLLNVVNFLFVTKITRFQFIPYSANPGLKTMNNWSLKNYTG